MEVAGVVISALNLVDLLIRSTQSIQRLNSEWKNAPTAIVAVRKELEYSKEVLRHLYGILPILETTPPHPISTTSPLSAAVTLKRKVDGTSATLQELQSLLSRFSQMDSKESRYRWIKCQDDIDKMRKTLKHSRRDIQEILQYWNTVQHHVMGMQLQRLSEHIGTVTAFCYRQTFLNTHGATQHRPAMPELEAGRQELRVVLPRLRSLQNLAVSSILPCPTPEEPSPVPPSELSAPSSQNSSIGNETSLPAIEPLEVDRSACCQDSPSDRPSEQDVSCPNGSHASRTSTTGSSLTSERIIPSCEPLCDCICHAHVRQARRGRPRLLKHLFGSLALGYISVSTPKMQCSVAGCQRATAGGFSITIRYTFPTWAAKRVLYSSISSCGLDNHFLTLSTSRRVPYAPGNIFSLINSRDFQGAARLLKSGAAHIRDVEATYGNSLLAATLRHATVRPGFVDFLHFLMGSQVNVHLPNDSGETPWLLAARLMLPAMPPALAPTELKNKLSDLFHHPDWSKLRFTHLHMVISGLRPLDLTQVLQDPRYLPQVNSTDALGQTPLSLAAMMGNVDAVKALLDAGASIGSCGSDLLRKAIHSRSKPCVELLTPLVKSFALDGRGATVIHTVAAGCDNLDLLEPLMLAGVSLDSLNVHRCTPLSFTPLNDNHNVARFLLSKRANINNVDKDGDTPLTEAIRLNAHNCLRLFIESGAKLETVNRRGWGVLHFAGAYGDVETLQILSTRRLKAEPWIDHEGNTPRDVFERRRRLAPSEVESEFERLLAGVRLTNR